MVCPICGLLYVHGDKTDESGHRRFHNRFLDGPQVTNRQLSLIQESNRTVIYVDERSNRKSRDLVLSAISRAAMDLGEAPPFPPHWKCYLVRERKKVIGFALIQTDVSAYLPSNPKHCKTCPIGVLRLWVLGQHRRRGIATTAVDAARHHSLRSIPKCMVAFSEPTEAGLAFARHYCGTEPFLFDIEI
jgi:hypothetical protein